MSDGWQLTELGKPVAAHKHHVLNARRGMAVTIFQRESDAIRHSPTLGDAYLTPRAAVEKLARYNPAIFEAWRRP